MNTDDLINQLGDDAKPVMPMRPPLIRAFLWIFVVAIFLVIGVVMGGARNDLSFIITKPKFIIESILLIVAGIMATIATFRLSVPNEKISIITHVLLGIAAAILLYFKAACLFKMNMQSVMVYMDNTTGIKILTKSLLISLVPAVLLFYLIKRGAPLRAGLTGGAAFLALANFSALGCMYMCPIRDPAYLFMWRYLPLILLIFVGLVLGRKVLKW